MAVRDRVGAHRERMREQGLRLVQVWVPDVRSDAFAAEAHRQSLAVAGSDRATDDQDYIEAVSALWDD
ncbi:antitoxin MazE family protein [Subtercola sp. YIM 133946]|uniref:antitoxin MazE family protein n=1 Tax=Subtercola sp. YIM 133946 TaxID=3118909 RepID=UPI002F946CEE